MDTYYVTFRVDARYTAKVEAENIEEAYAKAEQIMGDLDCGELYDIDWEYGPVEDANGNRLVD